MHARHRPLLVVAAAARPLLGVGAIQADFGQVNVDHFATGTVHDVEVAVVGHVDPPVLVGATAAPLLHIGAVTVDVGCMHVEQLAAVRVHDVEVAAADRLEAPVLVGATAAPLLHVGAVAIDVMRVHVEHLAAATVDDEERAGVAAVHRGVLLHARDLARRKVVHPGVVGVVHVVLDWCALARHASAVGRRRIRLAPVGKTVRRRVVDLVTFARAAVLERVQQAEPVSDLVHPRVALVERMVRAARERVDVQHDAVHGRRAGEVPRERRPAQRASGRVDRVDVQEATAVQLALGGRLLRALVLHAEPIVVVVVYDIARVVDEVEVGGAERVVEHGHLLHALLLADVAGRARPQVHEAHEDGRVLRARACRVARRSASERLSTCARRPLRRDAWIVGGALYALHTAAIIV
mmetsp:Transcript_28471/g.71090  ORF Transcript_28471/g.71090 Transcript_28471/m.71090 type:complete len:409 (-) Transcript_28471:134-1360(-)